MRINGFVWLPDIVDKIEHKHHLDTMSENIREERTSISKASTPQKIGEFWDSHSLADYSENIREVSFEVDVHLTGGRVAACRRRKVFE